MSWRGTTYNYLVVCDCPVRLHQEDQPFDLAVIMLDEVPVGASVKVVFEAAAKG